MAFDFSIITGKTIDGLVQAHPSQIVRIVREAYLAHGRGESVNPNSYFLRFPEKPNARIIALPAYLGGDTNSSGIKWISSYPDNVKRGFPRASAVLVLNDYETGYPYACLESSIISAARTAASAALAAEHLMGGPKRARSLGIVGTGLIARYMYQFLVHTGWEVDTVRLFDLNTADAERFQRSLREQGRHRDVVVDPDAPSLLRASDIILFATTAGTPHLHDVGLFAHNPLVLHISLRDLSPEILLASYNVVDDVEHVLKANTSPHLTEQQTGRRDFITGTLAQIMTGERRVDRSRPIIFSPFGLGVLDVAVGKWVYDQARASGEAIAIPDFFFELTR
jgi:2,3-diaminopropionate biosynthesis protein SbnB